MNNGRNGGVTSSFICENLNGIDLFVDGCSDVASGTVVNGATIVSAGQDMSSVGVVDIVVKDGKAISVTPITITANDVEDPANSELASQYGIVSIPSDKEVLTFIASQEAKIESALSEVVASTKYTLRAEDAKKQPTSATKLMVKATTEETGVDATIINGGMFAKNIEAGDVTVGDISDAFAYPYTVVLKEMTGAQIYAALEAGYSQLPEENVNYTLTDLKVIYNKYAKSGSRILRVKLGTEYIDKEMTYTIATNEYLGNNLGGYDMGKTVGKGGLFSDILIKYLNK
jgi:2',3'-cyclic-nucleotide 2'-phosphodiesterase (5'-nucleotidase family)